MADFPGKVNTQTSSPQSQSSAQIMNVSYDLNFIKSFPGILLLVELLFGLLVWPLVSSAAYWLVPAFGWVLFVSITLWILTLVLCVMLILGMRQTLSSIPWPLVLLVFYGVASVLYFTAFLANAVSVNYYRGSTYNHMAASAFFAFCVTAAYVASTFFAFIEWKGDGGNAVMSTVPV
ncbi:Plasmolipin [Bagarius yarrelli]|uniref:Plasmolipin n=1 Tax=Bagarius yarrelli TaxID=175774 RepID=A0A556V6R6_BAGYA|nr:Plasmolipin [Bagarius yarrelli]